MYTLKHQNSGAYLASLTEYTFNPDEAVKVNKDKAEFYRILMLNEIDLKIETL